MSRNSLDGSAAAPSSLVPFDSAEPAIPEEYIHEAGGADRLIPILDVRIAGIALCDAVSKQIRKNHPLVGLGWIGLFR